MLIYSIASKAGPLPAARENARISRPSGHGAISRQRVFHRIHKRSLADLPKKAEERSGEEYAYRQNLVDQAAGGPGSEDKFVFFQAQGTAKTYANGLACGGFVCLQSRFSGVFAMKELDLALVQKTALSRRDQAGARRSEKGPFGFLSYLCKEKHHAKETGCLAHGLLSVAALAMHTDRPVACTAPASSPNTGYALSALSLFYASNTPLSLIAPGGRSVNTRCARQPLLAMEGPRAGRWKKF